MVTHVLDGRAEVDTAADASRNLDRDHRRPYFGRRPRLILILCGSTAIPADLRLELGEVSSGMFRKSGRVASQVGLEHRG